MRAGLLPECIRVLPPAPGCCVLCDPLRRFQPPPLSVRGSLAKTFPIVAVLFYCSTTPEKCQEPTEKFLVELFSKRCVPAQGRREHRRALIGSFLPALRCFVPQCAFAYGERRKAIGKYDPAAFRRNRRRAKRKVFGRAFFKKVRACTGQTRTGAFVIGSCCPRSGAMYRKDSGFSRHSEFFCKPCCFFPRNVL